ncbi:SMC5-SMC6 complex localization factor protein 2 isoform X2 [Hypomesus transpacificus]|uniref:SMC5-SMC6 complex localization factor protein 2 isoform X2 n=1 Tax=Hypomesus transpacificus TaxID=137520 RepID=UPI001F0821E6|nr:SMC5-SMC6 complex localization factor protein 2 isoform X2 [Hypomesus transpacificus]
MMSNLRLTEYFTNAVKDLIPLGSHRHQGPVSKPVTHQEICMKPIQPSNHRPSYPPLRQALTLKRSDMDHRGKRASTYHPNSPGVPRGTPGSLTNSHSQVRKVQSAPISLNQSKDIRCNFGPGIGNPLSPPSNKSETPPLCKPSTPGSTSEEDSHKGGPRGGCSRPASQPRKLVVPPSHTFISGQEGHSLPSSHSDHWSPGSSLSRQHSSQSPGDGMNKLDNGCSPSPNMHVFLVNCLPKPKEHISLERKRTPSTERCPAGGSRSLSRKRNRNSETEDRDCIGDQVKRICPPDTKPQPMAGMKPRPSTASSQPLRSQFSIGTKQVYMKPSLSPTLKLQEWLSPVKDGIRYGQGMEEKGASPALTKPVKRLLQGQTQAPSQAFRDRSGNLQSGDTQGRSLTLSLRMPNKDVSKTEIKGSSGKPLGSIDPRASKLTTSFSLGSRRSRGTEQNKAARLRRTLIQQDELFTPDPVILVSNPAPKSKKSCSERSDCLSRSVSSSAALPSSVGAGSPSQITQILNASSSLVAPDPKTLHSSLVKQEPCKNGFVKLERIPLSKINSLVTSGKSLHASCMIKDNPKLTNSPAFPQIRQCEDESVQMETDTKSTVCPRDMEKTKGTPSLHPSPLAPPARLGGGEGERMGREKDTLDVELGLSLELDMDLSQSSSSSSEEDHLLSLQEILDGSIKPTDTPEKGTLPEPGTPVLSRCQSKLLPVKSKGKPVNYKNTLEQMLKEKESNQRFKEIEMKLLLSCKEDLLRFKEEEEESKENMEEAISKEHKEFLLRFSVVSSAIRDLHPGEEIFCLANFGRLFNQHTLHFRQCNVTPKGTAQKTLLWSSPDQFRLLLGAGLLQAAYRSSPCPPQVARRLFQLMSVYSERRISNQILQALRDIACSSAEHTEVNKSSQFEVWVPSISDVALVFMNMGVSFITLFPLESLQPPFTEGDLLEGIHISTESLSCKKDLSTFPEHNVENVIKYLSDVTALCPRAYCDTELLLLMTMVSRIGLEIQLTLLPTMDLSSLEHNLVNNMRDWADMLPRICLALSNLTEDHHNLRWLVQMLPDNTRGTQLRRHVSVAMISKLLNHTCTYKPTKTEFQLSDLQQYLPLMRPSALLKGMQLARSQRQREQEEDYDDSGTLDQQAYYLCYSLLALANEASNFEFFPPEQKNQLQYLCAQLEKHIKCDIRESEKCLYRSKVKDFVARIYTKWQVLLQRTRPLQGKLYDYWQPLPEDMLVCSQESLSAQREGDMDREKEAKVGEAVTGGQEESEEYNIQEGREENDLSIDEEEDEKKTDSPANVSNIDKEEMEEGHREEGKLFDS